MEHFAFWAIWATWINNQRRERGSKMIEKITNQNQIARHKLAEKINELVDAVNELQNRSSNTLIKTLRMDKEFAEEECKRLQTELDRTRKALEKAKKGLQELKDIIACPPDISYETCVSMYADGVLQEITALEQKD